MNQNNTQVTQTKPKFSSAITSPGFQRAIVNAIPDKKRRDYFQTSIIAAVNDNPDLAACEPSTILTCALKGHALGFAPAKDLGQFYMVPFKDNKRGISTATFQIGYKGYLQLAMRSGYYKDIGVSPVKEGELVSFDPIRNKFEFSPINDFIERESLPTVGYYAYFEYQNGFKKEIYWSKEQMEHHAITYSPGYKAKKGYTFWEKNFDAMAFKTMLRQLISKWGIMSIEMQEAYSEDKEEVEQEIEPSAAADVQPVETIEAEYKEVDINDL